MKKRTNTHRGSRRRGAAAVEFALVAPILVVLLLGAIDAGQFANAYQKVSNASREGARVAARYGTGNVSQVQAAVSDYLSDAFPGVPAATLNSAMQINVSDSAGNPPPNGNMTGTGTGNRVVVQVTLDFDSVRWINYLGVLGGRTIATTTVMRRE